MPHAVLVAPEVTPPVVRFIEPPTPPADAVVDAMVNRAREAQRQFEDWSEARIDELLHALSGIVYEHARTLAVAAVAETGMGNVRDKTLKNSMASVDVVAHMAGLVGRGEIASDSDRQMAEIASPVGVIVGLVPATHPVATFIFKALIALKGRNAIILSPSHRAENVSHQVGLLIQQALGAMGAPIDLVQWLGPGSSQQTVAALMSHKHVGMLLATGGQAMVQAAYRSGKPAIGVGPGNAPTLILADADLTHAALSTVQSKSFDNGLICGAENHLVVEARVRARLIAELEQQGAAVLTSDESAAFLDAAVSPETHRFRPEVVGQDAATLAKLARIERPYHIKLLVIPTESLVAENYLAAEKLAPVVSLFTVADLHEGLEVCRRLLEIDGAGHTAVIHTRDSELSRFFAAEIPASRILVNSPATQGLMGLTTGMVPSLTLGCGTWGGSSTTNSITYRDLLNIKHVAYYNVRARVTERTSPVGYRGDLS
jgi:acetaldehyde dehydrogenase / alcohol dehydrogenase